MIKNKKEICYETSMDTVAGNVTFENNVIIYNKKKERTNWYGVIL